jgi:perosamine synthetase
MSKINLYRPYSNYEEIEAVTEVLESGWWKQGPKCRELEKRFCEFTGAKNAITVANATLGLDLIFKAYDIKDCDVIVPAITFISTGIVPRWNNCNVIFADVRSDNLTISYEDTLKKLTPNTKVVIIQHQSGHAADIAAFDELKKKGILIIEDAAHGAGSYYKGLHVGIFNPAIFSFNVVKQIATGEGGIVTFPTKSKAVRAEHLRDAGIEENTWERENKKYKWDYVINELGYKYPYNDILASIALVQLKRLKSTNATRLMLVNRYLQNLADVNEVQLPYVSSDVIHSWHQFIIRVDENKRNKLIDFMIENEVDAGVHYKPINYYEKLWSHGDTPTSDLEWQRMVTLPLHPNLTLQDIDRVCNVIKRFYGRETEK